MSDGRWLEGSGAGSRLWPRKSFRGKLSTKESDIPYRRLLTRTSMIRVLRFLVVVVLAASCISIVGRVVSDFDLPPEEDPHDLARGIGVWVAAVLVSVLNEMRLRRRDAELPIGR